MDPRTEILHERAEVAGARPNVTPLFQCSSFLADSDYFYTRKGNPNSTELEAALRALEGCRHAISVTTGMAALTLALRLLAPGDHLVVNSLIYGCSYKLFHEYCRHFGIALSVVDLSEPGAVPPDARMVLFETPTNPFLRTVDIRAVRAAAPGALVVVDNTWATGRFQKPLALGADLCVYSATKFYSGHSDCMGGILTTDDDALAAKLHEYRFYSGSILDPHSAWLLRRSLQTFWIRMDAHAKVTDEMRAFLSDIPEVEAVYHPDVDGKQLTGYGGILFIELRPQHAWNVERFVSSLTLFERGTSMACVVSAVAQPYCGSHLSLSESEKAAMGIRPTLIRLCFGLEAVDDLKRDLLGAFRALHE